MKLHRRVSAWVLAKNQENPSISESHILAELYREDRKALSVLRSERPGQCNVLHPSLWRQRPGRQSATNIRDMNKDRYVLTKKWFCPSWCSFEISVWATLRSSPKMTGASGSISVTECKISTCSSSGSVSSILFP